MKKLSHCPHLYTVLSFAFLQMVPGALLPATGLRLPASVTTDGWTSASPLDNVNSLANYITGLHAALPRSLPALNDTPEGACSSLYARFASTRRLCKDSVRSLFSTLPHKKTLCTLNKYGRAEINAGRVACCPWWVTVSIHTYIHT